MSSGKTLFLHVGAPKCASSTLQRAFFVSRKLLRSHDISYPLPGKKLGEFQGNATHFALAAIKLGFNSDKAQSYMDHIFQSDKHVLLSSEYLYGFAMGNVLTQLANKAWEKNFKIHVILILRRQDLWLESDYKQHIKGGALWHGSVQDLIETRTKNRTLEYDFVLDRWAKWSDKISVFVLNKSTPSEEIIQNTFSSLGLPLDKVPQSIWRTKINISPENHLFEAANQIKRGLVEEGYGSVYIEQNLRKFFQKNKGTKAIAPIPSLLNTKQRNMILTRFAEGNKLVAQKYFNRDALFDPVIEENLSNPESHFRASAELAQNFLLKRKRFGKLRNFFTALE